jgi:hypothetical protein
MITVAVPHKAMLGQHYTTCAKPGYDSVLHSLRMRQHTTGTQKP